MILAGLPTVAFFLALVFGAPLGFVAVLFVGYVAGIPVTVGFLAAVGARNPSTRGSSFTGSEELDLLLAAWWPVFLPGWLLYTAAHRLAAWGFE